MKTWRSAGLDQLGPIRYQKEWRLGQHKDRTGKRHDLHARVAMSNANGKRNRKVSLPKISFTEKEGGE